MRLRRHFEQDGGETGIDLAPMLDFVLNLLIFFIITAVFVKESALTISRPSTKAAQTKEAGAIRIQITANGDIAVESRIVDVRAVRANIERQHALKPDDGAVVFADKDAPNGVLVQVLDQIRQGGVEQVSISSGTVK